MRAAIYLRVSTTDQTTENQRQALEAVAAAREWSVVATYEDHGISLRRQGPRSAPGVRPHAERCISR
jgi:DNA invertase Pin-like site-specific DNA recombinase